MKDVIIYHDQSAFNTYRVVEGMYEGRMARVLYSGVNTPQSGLALDDDSELLFDYNQRFVEIFHSLRPRRVLIIGGGAFTLPVALARLDPVCHIDVVEIDPMLSDIAHTFFGLDPGLGINVIIQDGVAYMRDCRDQYDLIIVDAFSGPDIVGELFSTTMAQRYAACLSDGGVVAVNVIAKYRTRRRTFMHDMLDHFTQAFPVVDTYPADYVESARIEQNLLLVAAASQPELDYLQSASVEVLTPQE